jgi:iron uptake system EfeUOB component EfeO/EfeM
MFAPAAKLSFIRAKITKFHDILRPLISKLPKDATEDLDTNFSAIQSILRIARNDAGHPTGATLQREQVYVFLQLFIPFARQTMRLRMAFA